MAPIKIISTSKLNDAIDYFLEPASRPNLTMNDIIEMWLDKGFDQTVLSLSRFDTGPLDSHTEVQRRIDKIRSVIGGTVVKTPSLLVGKAHKEGYIPLNRWPAKGDPEIDSVEILCALFPELFTHFDVQRSPSSVRMRFFYVKRVAKSELSEWYNEHFNTPAKKEEALQTLMLALAGRPQMEMGQIIWKGPVGLQNTPSYSKGNPIHLLSSTFGSLEDHLANIRALLIWKARIEAACGAPLKELSSRKGIPKLLEYLKADDKMMALLGSPVPCVAKIAQLSMG